MEYNKYVKSCFAMGTDLTIIIFTSNAKKADEILSKCEKIANELENKVSCKLSSSIISLLNRKKRLIIKDDFVYELITEAYNLSKITNGAFDPSLFNLTDIWGFDKGNKKVPDKKLINEILLKCGIDNVEIRGREVFLKNGVSLDLGAIAKGKIVSEIGKYLDKEGLIDYLINGGGDILAKGFYGNKRKWKIAIANPYNKSNYIGFIELSNMSIVTSGDYERCFYEKGKLYHHILDPKTGFPAENDVHSVTVITDDTAKADAFATALFVLGKDIGLAYANKFNDIAAIFVVGDKKKSKVYVTDNITMQENDGIYYFKVAKKYQSLRFQ
jgi:thiamine biosynthesis lipoprotein